MAMRSICPAGRNTASSWLGMAATVLAAGTSLAAPSSVSVHGVDAARARRIADHAEGIRREACATLLDEREPPPWTPRCEIHVHLSAASFARAVGAAPSGARGATSIEFAGEAVSLRRIDVMGDGDAEIPDALAHELVHVVLADRFTESAPPRWADEGLALLFDSDAKQTGHEADFRRAYGVGAAFTTADILALEHYPNTPGRQRVFYGQSAALVRWLIARRGAAAFIDFLDDASRSDVRSALERHYGLDSLASLDAAWKEVPAIASLASAGQVR